jgi:hypothetical protein
MAELNTKAFGGLLGLLVVMAALLFILAGTLDYWQAWAFLALFFVLALAITVYLTKKDPKLLERRVYAGPAAEKERSQKIIQFIASIGFIAMLAVPALDHRFRWSQMSLYAAVGGDLLVAIGFLIVFLVYKKILWPRQPSKWLPSRKSYRPDCTQSCVIRCTWEAFSTPSRAQDRSRCLCMALLLNGHLWRHQLADLSDIRR